MNVKYYLSLSLVKRIGDVDGETIGAAFRGAEFVFDEMSFTGFWPRFHISAGPIIFPDGVVQGNYISKRRIIQLSESMIRSRKDVSDGVIEYPVAVTLVTSHEAAHHVQNVRKHPQLKEVCCSTLKDRRVLREHPLEVEAWEMARRAISRIYDLEVTVREL